MNIVENGPVDTVEKGEGGMNWESSVDIYILSCEKQLVESCYKTQGAQPGVLWWPRELGRGRRGRFKRKEIYV